MKSSEAAGGGPTGPVVPTNTRPLGRPSGGFIPPYLETAFQKSPVLVRAPARASGLLPEDTEVVLLDLWRTLARGPYPEPIDDLRRILKLDMRVDREEFLKVCLTTRHEDPALYLQDITRHFGIVAPATALGEFREIVRTEIEEVSRGDKLPSLGTNAASALAPGHKNPAGVFEDVLPTLQWLSQRKRLGLVTNCWPFPVRALLNSHGLMRFFEHVIVSAECGMAKQDGPGIYELSALMFGVRPNQCVMIDDNPKLGIFPPLACGMNVVLIDRYGDYLDENGQFKTDEMGQPAHPEMVRLGIRAIRTLGELPGLLG